MTDNLYRASVRSLISKVFLTEDELRAFVIDWFPEHTKLLANAMSYMAILNVLLEYIDSKLIASRIQSKYPALYNKHCHVLSPNAQTVIVASATQSGEIRTPVPPARSAYDPTWYASRPSEESMALEALDFPGAAVALLAPEAFGKTWLLQHILRAVKTRGRIVNLNLRVFGTAEIMSSYSRFLREFARQILVDATDLTSEQAALEVEDAWRYADNPIDNLNTLMENRVLPRFSGGAWLILALDGVDAMGKHPYLEEFFTLLRGWMEDAARPPWAALRLLLTLATAPRLLVSNIHQSPFNIATMIELYDLEHAQIARLSELYGLHWSSAEIDTLTDLVGGHPYLLRLLMHEAKRTGKDVVSLASGQSSAMNEYLLHCKRRLSAAPALHDAFMKILANSNAALSFDIFDRLRHAGFLIRDASSLAYAPRYKIYQRLLDSHGEYLTKP